MISLRKFFKLLGAVAVAPKVLSEFSPEKQVNPAWVNAPMDVYFYHFPTGRGTRIRGTLDGKRPW